MCLIKGAFVGENNFDVNKMHGTTIKILNNKLIIKFYSKIIGLKPL